MFAEPQQAVKHVVVRLCDENTAPRRFVAIERQERHARPRALARRGAPRRTRAWWNYYASGRRIPAILWSLFQVPTVARPQPTSPVGIWRRRLALIHGRWTPMRSPVSRACSSTFFTAGQSERGELCMAKQRRRSSTKRGSCP